MQTNGFSTKRNLFLNSWEKNYETASLATHKTPFNIFIFLRSSLTKGRKKYEHISLLKTNNVKETRRLYVYVDDTNLPKDPIFLGVCTACVRIGQ